VLLDRYELHEVIGRGGMATVHLGRQRGSVGFARVVAIKRMHPHLAANSDFVEMFLDEARLASRVRHPNVMSILDLVAVDEDLLQVMEYVPGVTLSHVLKEVDRIPQEIVLRIISDVLHGLDAAHHATDGQGESLHIVHRDVSPHNLLIGTDGATRVLDFGIAKAVGKLHQTDTGQTKGKFGYMAPEQLRSGNLDRRADIYSVGVVLWEALVGRTLFEADSEAELVHCALTASIEPPTAIDESIPEKLSAMTMRALARKPSDRFANALEMARALEDTGIDMATVRETGEWVSEIGEKQLAERARAVARVEQAEPAEPVDSARDGGAKAGELTGVPTKVEGRGTGMVAAFSQAPPPIASRWRVPVAMTLLGGVLAAGWQLGKSSSPEVATTLSHDSSASSDAPLPPPTVDGIESSAAPTASGEASSATTPSASASAKHAPSSTPSASGPPPRSVAGGPTPRPPPPMATATAAPSSSGSQPLDDDLLGRD